MAEALVWQLELTRACGPPAALSGGWSLYTTQSLWPRELHSPILDSRRPLPARSGSTPLPRRSSRLRPRPGDLVVGPHDSSGKHFRFAVERVGVVYDWDSLALGREAVIVGNAAMTFTANFDLPGLSSRPRRMRCARSSTSTALLARPR
jgi:hypothetical protein